MFSIGKLDAEMLRVQIMLDTGWTFEEYQSQPFYVLELVKEKMRREAKEQEQQNRKMKQKYGQ